MNDGLAGVDGAPKTLLFVEEEAPPKLKDGCALLVEAPPKLNPPEVGLVAGFEACPKGFATGAFEVLPKTEPAVLVLDPKGVGAPDDVFPNTEAVEF